MIQNDGGRLKNRERKRKRARETKKEKEREIERDRERGECQRGRRPTMEEKEKGGVEGEDQR